MSELLKKLAAYVRSTPGREVRVALGQNAPGEEPTMLPGSEPKTVGHNLEGRKIDAVPVGDPVSGELRCFLDGIQRPRGPIYFDSPVPVLYGYSAAAIRRRGDDRRMRTQDGGHLSREALYLPMALVSPSDREAFSGFGVVDTGEQDEKLEEHPMQLLERAKKKVSLTRERLEAKLVSQWLAEFDGDDDWILVDGSLAGDYDRYDSPNVVGVVKSHQTQYFEWEEQCKILDLKVGERSGVFIPGGRKRPDVYSWYLRLQPSEGRDVYFGLVRVEAAKCQRTLDMADEVSRWLLAERTPLSLPDGRWDRLIYPIHDCEQYLKSIAPSHTALDGLLLSLAALGRR